MLSIKYVIHQLFWSKNEPLSHPGLSVFYLLSDRLKLFNQHFIFHYVYGTSCTNNDVTREMGTETCPELSTPCPSQRR